MRTNLLLLAVLLASSLALVHVSYDTRQQFSELDRLLAEAKRLDQEHERLLAERQAQATPLRVERLARERLAMRNATPSITQYVALPAAAPPPGGRP